MIVGTNLQTHAVKQKTKKTKQFIEGTKKTKKNVWRPERQPAQTYVPQAFFFWGLFCSFNKLSVLFIFVSITCGSGRLARSRKSSPGGPEVVNEECDKELNREMDGFS